VTIVVLGAAALLVGAIVGAVGVGGVMLAPALILLGGVEPHQATAISLIAFILAGAVSAGLRMRHAEVPLGTVLVLAIGLVPGAFLGGWSSDRIPEPVILGALCAVCLLSAVWTAVRFGPSREDRDTLPVGSGAPLGLAVGFGSAVTGTSGPVLLTPALIAAGFPASRAIVAGQIVQVIVTPVGASGHLLRGLPDIPLALVLGAATALGAALGIVGMRRWRPREIVLRWLVSALLIGTGVLVAVRLLV
jgi:uncharacterized membrane protein YfcA